MIEYRHNFVKGGSYFSPWRWLTAANACLWIILTPYGQRFATLKPHTFSPRRHGYPAGALALHLDVADWRRQLFRSLAAHQGSLFTLLARLQSSLSQQNPEKRTRYLAASLYTPGIGLEAVRQATVSLVR